MQPADADVKFLVVSWARRREYEARASLEILGTWRINAVPDDGTSSFPIAFGSTEAEAWRLAAEAVADSCGKSVVEMLVSEDLKVEIAEGDDNED